MELLNDCRDLATALAATPVQDVPVWFTYDVLLYTDDITTVPVIKINGINYFYIRRNVLITADLLVQARNLITLVLRTDRVDVGYYTSFYDFVSVVTTRPGVVTGINTGALLDVIDKLEMNPTVRQRYLMATGQISLDTSPQYTLSTLPIPTVSPDHQTPEAITQWNIIRKFAYEQLKSKSSDHRPDEPTRVIITTPVIMAHLLKYGIRIGHPYHYDVDHWIEAQPQWAGKSYEQIVSEFMADVYFELAKQLPVSIYEFKEWNDYNNSRVLLKESGKINQLQDQLLYSYNYNLFKTHGYAHHDAVLIERKRLDDWFGNNDEYMATIEPLSLDDIQTIIDRYPVPPGHQDQPELSLESRVRIMKKFPRSFDDRLLLEMCMDDDSIPPAHKAIILSKYYDTAILIDQFPGYEDVSGYGRMVSGMTSVTDYDFGPIVVHLKSYLGIHPYIDSAIQDKICTFYGYDITELTKHHHLVVAICEVPSIRSGVKTVISKVVFEANYLYYSKHDDIVNILNADIDNILYVYVTNDVLLDESTESPFAIYSNIGMIPEPMMRLGSSDGRKYILPPQ